LAESIRERRSPAGPDNPFVAMQETASQHIVAALDMWAAMRDSATEWTFLNTYGSPALQAAVGIDPADSGPMRKAAKNPLHRELLDTRIAELKSRITKGGLREATVRALIYVGMARGGVDERGIEAIRGIRLVQEGPRLTLPQFKAMVREQYFMLIVDPEAALAAIPHLLPPSAESRRSAFAALRQVLSARGEIGGEAADRLRRMSKLFVGNGHAAKVPGKSRAMDREKRRAS